MNKDTKSNYFFEQFIPLALTFITLFVICGSVWLTIKFLNALNLNSHISTELHISDILIGATIYLKTAVDFAIFMGRLMQTNPGWKNRVAIEIGTALGNGLGTILILIIWTFFKEVNWLLSIMILLASLVLFELAYGGLEHFSSWEAEPGIKKKIYLSLNKFLTIILKYIGPVLNKIMPDLGQKLKGESKLSFKKLVLFSFSIPFILGLDDFAGYVPLFNVVNVFGFSVGVISAHTLLNIALFINPTKTVTIVRNAWISLFGTLAFIGLAIWGIFEAIKLL